MAHEQPRSTSPAASSPQSDEDASDTSSLGELDAIEDGCKLYPIFCTAEISTNVRTVSQALTNTAKLYIQINLLLPPKPNDLLLGGAFIDSDGSRHKIP